MKTTCLVESHIFKTSTIRKISVRGFHGNREFHVPFCSMIYVALKFTLSVSEIEFYPSIDDYAKDGGKELFTKMHCILITNP